MSQYVTDDEEIIWQSREGKNYRRTVLIWRVIVSLALIAFSWIGFNKIGFIGVGKYVVFGLIVLCGIYVASKQMALLFNLYIVTDDRIIIKRGFLNRKLTSLRYENITDTKVEQSIWGRIIKTGSIYFLTANNTHDSEGFTERIPEFRHVDHPFQELSRITKQMKKEED